MHQNVRRLCQYMPDVWTKKQQINVINTKSLSGHATLVI